MRRKTAVVLGVAGAALALTASSAFTATGLTTGTGVTANKVIGGSFTQTLSGLTLDTIAYTWDDDEKTKLKKIDLTFASASAAFTPAVTLTGSTPSVTGATWSCTEVTTTTLTSNCTLSSGYVTGVSTVKIDAAN